MFTKTAIALTIVLATASGALAATKKQQQHSTNPGHDVYSNGVYIGSDPDASVRTMLLFDH